MRLRNVLVLVVTLFVLGASSQAAVCELACGPQVATMQCGTSAAVHAETMVMSGGHCAHAMVSTQVVVQSAGVENCGHASVPALAKGGSSTFAFAAVQWVLVGVVPVDPALMSRAVRLGSPPLVPVGVDPLVVSLRV